MALGTDLDVLKGAVAGCMGATWGLGLDMIGAAWSEGKSSGHPSGPALWRATRARRASVAAASAAVSIGSIVLLPLMSALVNALLLPTLFVLALLDLTHYRLPNVVVYPVVAIGVVGVLIGAAGGAGLDPVAALISAAIFGGGLYAIARLSGGGIGMGDVKVSGMIGWYFGAVDWRSAWVAAAVAIALGGVVALTVLARGGGRQAKLPFGPMLAAGAVVGGLWGPLLAGVALGGSR